MAKHHNGGEELLLVGGLAVGGWFLYQQFLKTSAAATPAAAAALPSSGSASVLAPPASSSSSASVAAGGGSTTATTPVLIPAVPLNSIGTLVGTTANGTQIVEQGSVSTPYGTVIPSNLVTTPNPATGAELPVDIVGQVQTPTVINVPATTTTLQTSTAICPTGLAAFANNNPAGANNGATFSTLQAGLQAAFQELLAIYNIAPSAFTISQIANYWVNVNKDGIPWSASVPGANQTSFESLMQSLTGFGDYNVDANNQTTMITLMRGIIGCVSGAQYFGTLSDACLASAYNAA